MTSFKCTYLVVLLTFIFLEFVNSVCICQLYEYDGHLRQEKRGWKYLNSEGILGTGSGNEIGSIFDSPIKGTTPLYEVLNTTSQQRFYYVTDDSGGFKSEKIQDILGYVFLLPETGTIPLFQYRQTRTTRYFSGTSDVDVKPFYSTLSRYEVGLSKPTKENTIYNFDLERILAYILPKGSKLSHWSIPSQHFTYDCSKAAPTSYPPQLFISLLAFALIGSNMYTIINSAKF